MLNSKFNFIGQLAVSHRSDWELRAAGGYWSFEPLGRVKFSAPPSGDGQNPGKGSAAESTGDDSISKETKLDSLCGHRDRSKETKAGTGRVV